MASTLVGWELLHKLIEANLKSESAVLIAITHWFLIKEGGFRCLGTGDNVCIYALHLYSENVEYISLNLSFVNLHL